jgi:hypothetical protein
MLGETASNSGMSLNDEMEWLYTGICLEISHILAKIWTK